ncbi:anthrone oxygenase family protein [Chelativorans sp. AA-79]|uniref:anthrone oxygenase family protein n=1 Tax=Chelativorans sp. AA-79 TaxID=3028735 RepID=UPI0023F8E856|nr:anthrone oxygenase family protein [Chelativorans sp. AA-79]WEX08957.1 DUF1772 domain-containing protein [Chelativorans sp. AA-79]
MAAILYPFAILSLLLSGAIFGFFYAWVCSTMWGLDAADPTIAIEAMQAMNASVRNAVFAPAFFGTPVVLTMTAALAFQAGFRRSALAFLGAALVYFFGGLLLTMVVNVPMNEALARIDVPADSTEAQGIWRDYSDPWKFWNTARTAASGVSLMLTGIAILALSKRG